MGSIYLITNLINNKKYVGQTKRQITTRIKEHLQIAQNTKYNLHLYNSIRKYGVDNFSIEVLKTDIPEMELDKWEMYYIGLYDTYNNGYNNTLGGGGVRGYHHSEETKQKISKSQLEHQERYTEERAKKISYALKGRPFSEEHKKHLSESRLKNPIKYCGEANGFYGKHHTQESKQKMHNSSIKYYVLQLSNNKVINKFECVEDSAKYLIDNNYTKAKLSSVMYRIYQTCLGNQKVAYGFNWKYQKRCNDYLDNESTVEDELPLEVHSNQIKMVDDIV